MNIVELILKQIRKIQAIVRRPDKSGFQPESRYPVGKNVIIRTVTMIYTGKLHEVTPTDLILIDCSWIPETERFMSFVAEGKVRECEPYPDGLPVYINRGALLDMCELQKDLPRSQK
ncbi:MAG: hypothetical protein ACYC0Z_12990 [Acidobacteriaceae bacterium]